VITLGIFQTGVMPTDLLFGNQCKVVKVVHGDRSDDHCNQSDTWRMMAIYHCYSTRALLVLVVVLSLVPLTHTHTQTYKQICTHMHAHMHIHTNFFCFVVVVYSSSFFVASQQNT